jgi:hypothetical protein
MFGDMEGDGSTNPVTSMILGKTIQVLQQYNWFICFLFRKNSSKLYAFSQRPTFSFLHVSAAT